MTWSTKECTIRDNKNLQNSVGETSSDAFIRSISTASEQPMREEQVQNAVKFLSHPKVRGSPVVYRRSFLEKKGLTREEIDEAFRRVPDPPSNTAVVEAAKPAQGSLEKPSTALQSQVPAQTIQTAVAPSNIVPPAPALQSRFQWPYIVLAVGVLATSGAGTAVLFKNAVIPRLKAWIRKVVKEEDDAENKVKMGPSAAEEAAEAAKTAASAAAVVAKACQDLLSARSEEKKYFETFMGLLDAQVKEMKSMGSAIRDLETTRESIHQQDKRKADTQFASGNGPINNTRMAPTVNQSDSRLSSVSPQGWKVNGTEDRSSSAPASVESTETPYPKSFMEEINDMPPNPNQQPSNPRLAPRMKPWEAAAQAQQSSGYGWTSETQDNGLTSPANGNPYNGPEPSWKQKTPELEEQGSSSYGFGSKNWPGRDWVPPQTPSVAIPEAAAAIRKPKPKQPPPAEPPSVPPSGLGEVDILQVPPELAAGAGSSDDGPSDMNHHHLSEIKQEDVDDVVEAH
ncbi:unnamed protein product [Spirodela intermedia]|uniref:Peroxisomal membrane protein PEX14 n=1 Tax=Spirodela intermedia TaxID=51605 RepID=A0A7I8J5Q7_SPIIN|nr:unnamed protein product [Spirodela intermedia]CAA6665568.1 unnamed protein product [Spirodela intermedia]